MEARVSCYTYLTTGRQEGGEQWLESSEPPSCLVGLGRRSALHADPLQHQSAPSRSRVWLGHVETLAMSRRKPRASLAMSFLASAKAGARAVIAWSW